MDITNIGSEIKKKSFWKKPEGITGMLFIGALLFGLYKALPYLIKFAENSIYLAVLCGGAALVTYVLLDNKVVLWYAYKKIMYNITNAVYRIDPISTAKVYIMSMRNKKDNINEQIEKLGGSIKSVQITIEENEKSIDKNLEKTEQANNLNMKSQAMLAGKEALRLQDWNKELQPLLSNMQKTNSFLKKMFEMADYIIKDKESEITILEKKYKSTKIALSALRSAQAVMGQDAKEAGFEQAMEFIKEDMANKIGEMDRILELATPYLNELDLNNAIQDNRVNELLNSFNEGEFTKGLKVLEAKTQTSVPLENTANKTVKISETADAHDKYFNN